MMEQWEQLRQPFPPEAVGKKPKITCSACSRAKFRNCDRHEKAKCRTCGNWITTAHMHLDYVGHAEVTNRLLDVDPDWDWEPLAFNSDGLPAMDANGGMWIRLTIAGVSRIGYGHPDGKGLGDDAPAKRGDAIKETIGDAIRNAALRFGVAIELWGAHRDDEGDSTPAEPSGNDPVPEPSEAQVALAALEQAMAELELEPAKVLRDYQSDYDMDPRRDTDAGRLRAFTASLRAKAAGEQPEQPEQQELGEQTGEAAEPGETSGGAE